jgi:hypothetical protein
MTLRLALDGIDFFSHCLPASDEPLPDPAARRDGDDHASRDPLGLKPGGGAQGSCATLCMPSTSLPFARFELLLGRWLSLFLCICVLCLTRGSQARTSI